jgi:tRNA-splicing ligase RtcB (3'-phosphate/5'-hydroxy nucleic acid ligase)
MAWTGPLRPAGPAVHEIPADYRGETGGLRMNVPGRIVASQGLLASIQDDQAPEQVAQVACLPGIVGYSLAMPDIHWGYGFPIGGVAAFDPDAGGVVSPGGVGFDINCGVRLLRTGLHERDLRPRLKETVDALFDVVPCGMGSRGGLDLSEAQLVDILDQGAGWAVDNGYATAADRESMEDKGAIAGADARQVHERARVRGRRSLGSLGSGNHFLELQVVDKTWDAAACKSYGVETGDVLAMIHTGSRGLGHQVCEDHVRDLQAVSARHGIALPDRQLACAPLGTPEADRYLAAMASAANFAFVNRSVITTHVRSTLGRMFGLGADDVSVLYDVCHNIAKMEEHVVPAGPDAGKRKPRARSRPGTRRCLPRTARSASRSWCPATWAVRPSSWRQALARKHPRSVPAATAPAATCPGRPPSGNGPARNWCGPCGNATASTSAWRLPTWRPRRLRRRTRTSASSWTASRRPAWRARRPACGRSAWSKVSPPGVAMSRAYSARTANVHGHVHKG